MIDSNKKVFITGATGGIGQAITDRFLEENYKLILISSSEERINILKKKYGDNHFFYQVDIGDGNNLENMMNKISNDHKDISIIINNAGVTHDNLLLRMTAEQWSSVIKTNLESNYVIIKSLLPNMLSNRFGKIVGISSVVASTGNPGQSNYVASKSGMIGLYKSIALEVAKRNINVNLVSPGFITTSMTEKLNDKQKQNILSKIPMDKFGEAKDVANLVYFLSSDESSYITGQNFNINGGMLMV